jgi:adenylate cyclase
VTGCLRISIRHQDWKPFSAAFSQAVELGRRDPASEQAERMFQPIPIDGGVRIAIAEPQESDVSRRQLRLELLGSDRIRIVNLSKAIVIRCGGYETVAPGDVLEQALPVNLQVGRIVISASSEVVDGDKPAGEELAHLQTLSDLPPVPLADPLADSSDMGSPQGVIDALISGGQGSDAKQVVLWWRQVIAVLQSASNSTDFFHKAAEAIVNLVGLSLGAVFLWRDGEWKPVAIVSAANSSARPSTRVLERLLTEKRTFWSKGDSNVDVLSSMAVLDAYVASPILDRSGEVLGVLYGHREGRPATGGGSGITQIEALLIETLASGVAVGLARLEQEKVAVQQRVQFEQFFSPQLAAQLETEPDLLRGRDAEVTVLFCDIRDFSAVSERLGPAQTMDWIGGVLSPLSEEVATAGGVLVDYVGDELMAMWGAPSSQPDHATLACRTAQAMVAAIPRINARWAELVGGPTRFGIGINSTTARVGNTGSNRKFKYGPLGNGVNLASRVQGATKYLRVSAIITGATCRLLGDACRVRRLCCVQVVNIAEAVELFELDCDDTPPRGELFLRYEEALVAFEAGNFSNAARLLGGLLDSFPGDGPGLVLLSRAVDAMVNEKKDFSVVWRLPGK